ncbi:hypothetical protein LSAT2_013557 [Lamellibrachia satsuma]|nr:hypothetical protein LSAT2_013557 [Lamellibrachia satsuma]
MNFNDIFKSVFGFSGGLFHPSRGSADDDAGDPMSPPGFYGDSGDGCDNDDEVPHHFHFESTEPDEMFRHFENMFRSFDELFRSMGMAQFSANEPVSLRGLGEVFPGFPDEHHVAPPQARGSLRDRMLKEPDTPSGGRSRQIFDFEESPIGRSPSLFGRLWGVPSFIPQFPSPKEKVDKDLDSEIKDASELDDIFAKQPKTPQSSAPMEPSYRHSQPQGTFKSVSVWTRIGADGKVEEHRSVRDNRGNEEEVVTKRIGEQGYCVTKKRDSMGREEVKESYNNMDERDKDNFEQLWSIPSVLPDPRNRSPRQQLFPSEGDSYDPQTRSIFHNLFGFSFPGFGKS